MNEKGLKRVCAGLAVLVVLLILCVAVLLCVNAREERQLSEEAQIEYDIYWGWELTMERNDGGQEEGYLLQQNRTMQGYLVQVYRSLEPCNEQAQEENWIMRFTIDQGKHVFEFYKDHIRFNGENYILENADYGAILEDLNHKFSAVILDSYSVISPLEDEPAA